MQICQMHWDKMRARLDELGIGHLGPKDGEGAADAARKQLERAQAGGDGEPTNEEWDPLMAMNFAFWNWAVEVVGLEAMAPDFGCPLCHARADYDLHSKPGGCGQPGCERPQDTSLEPTDENWIRTCGDAMRKETERRGLVRLS